MVIYVGALLIFSSLYLDEPIRLLKGVAIVAIYAAADILWTRLREKTWYVPVSSFISGFILALVAIPSPPLWMIFALPLLAVISKQLIHFGKIRHIFNPASFAMGVVAFAAPAISWWAVAWGAIPLYIVLAAGLGILWKQKRFHVAVPFAISYSFFLALLFLKNGIPASQLLAFLKPQLFDGTPLFFATIMLIEPITSNFPTKRQRMIYGTLVGFFAVLLTYIGDIIPLADPLIYGLLLSNLICSLLFIKPKTA